MSTHMKTIKVKTVDFGSGNYQNNFIVRQLSKNYNVVISDDPDFLIYSVEGNEHLQYHCTKIFYTGEPITPNFNECDYAIGFDPLKFAPRYLRLPLFAMQITSSIQDRTAFKDVNIDSKKFCNFIYSNEFAGNGAFLRKEFCKKLMQYKKVDCPGMVLHNMESDNLSTRWGGRWHEGKLKFIRDYKFTIAFENSLMDGYTTEKLIQPLMVGSIPIYYGNPRVTEEFNHNSFIDCNIFDNDFDAVIEEVKRVDNDPELAKYMILQSPMQQNYDFAWEKRLEDFLVEIIERGRKHYDHMIRKKAVSDTYKQNTLNYHMYKNGIIEGLKRYEEIVIYGNGNFARKIVEFLKVEKVSNVSACLITKGNDAGREFMGLPIITISDWVPKTDNPLILIAIRETVQEELISNLIDKGYCNFLSINDFLMGVIEDSKETTRRT